VSSEITPGERRELRSVVRGQFKVLRAEVKRREQELKGEVETELLTRYREQDAAIAEAGREAYRIRQDALRALAVVADALRDQHPDLTVDVSMSYQGPEVRAANHNRAQLHRALMASIPNRVGDAQLNLDRGENDLLRQLSTGALESTEARGFLNTIPTVGELVPRVRLNEIEQQIGGGS